MIALEFLTNILAASMLLLFAVRLIRTGAERSFAPQLRRLLSNSGRGLGAAGSGMLMAVALQGSTPAILLVSGLVSTGIVGLPTGLALTIGADIGSAIVVRVLSLEVAWLAPFLMAVGGWLYLKTNLATPRNVGRIVLGIALVLVALQMIGGAVAPIGQASLLPDLVGYLERDLVLATLLGIMLTFILHSSVASILVWITLTASGEISLPIGIAFVLGCNAGSGLISVWLTRGCDMTERHLPILNLAVRCLAASVALIALAAVKDGALAQHNENIVTGVLLAHFAFNVSLLAFLPMAGWMSGLLMWALPAGSPGASASMERLVGAVAAEDVDVGNPGSVARRDVLVMLDAVSNMISESERLIAEHDARAEQGILVAAQRVNKHFAHMRAYFARSTREDVSADTRNEMRQLLDYVFRLEQVADIVATRMVATSHRMREARLSFSAEGRGDLEKLRRLALSNTFLAFEVVSTWQSEPARQLVARKEEFSRLEKASREQHFKRISEDNNSVSLETSDMHLEMSASLKEINSKIATIAYTVLSHVGQLADSRLLSTPNTNAF